MKGHNQLYVNQATMIEAMEYWLNNSQLTKPTKVENVEKDSASGGFNIKLSEPEEAS